MIHLNPIFNSDAAPRMPFKDFSVKSFRKKSELLNAFIFTTNENQNRILDLGRGPISSGSEFNGNKSQTVNPNKHSETGKF